MPFRVYFSCQTTVLVLLIAAFFSFVNEAAALNAFAPQRDDDDKKNENLNSVSGFYIRETARNFISRPKILPGFLRAKLPNELRRGIKARDFDRVKNCLHNNVVPNLQEFELAIELAIGPTMPSVQSVFEKYGGGEHSMKLDAEQFQKFIKDFFGVEFTFADLTWFDEAYKVFFSQSEGLFSNEYSGITRQRFPSVFGLLLQDVDIINHFKPSFDILVEMIIFADTKIRDLELNLHAELEVETTKIHEISSRNGQASQLCFAKDPEIIFHDVGKTLGEYATKILEHLFLKRLKKINSDLRGEIPVPRYYKMLHGDLGRIIDAVKKVSIDSAINLTDGLLESLGYRGNAITDVAIELGCCSVVLSEKNNGKPDFLINEATQWCSQIQVLDKKLLNRRALLVQEQVSSPHSGGDLGTLDMD